MSITNTNGILGTTNPGVETALGNVPGRASVLKFGRNPELDIASAAYQDVWEVAANSGSDYAFFPATAQSMEIVSTSANDTSAGTGARSVLVQGLDNNYAEISETVSMNGTSTVALSNTYIAVNRAYVVSSGSSGFNEGLIDVQIAPSSTIAARIGLADSAAGVASGDGLNQTTQAIYTVPANKQFVITSGFINVNKAKDAIANFQYQTFGDSFRTIGVASSFESFIPFDGIPNFVCEQKSVVKIAAQTANNNTFISAGFSGVLVDT